MPTGRHRLRSVQVASGASLAGGLQLQSVHTARDGTRKLVFALVGDWEGGDGPAGSARGTVETVLIPMTNRQGQNLRYTACLSTQVRGSACGLGNGLGFGGHGA